MRIRTPWHHTWFRRFCVKRILYCPGISFFGSDIIRGRRLEQSLIKRTMELIGLAGFGEISFSFTLVDEHIGETGIINRFCCKCLGNEKNFSNDLFTLLHFSAINRLHGRSNSRRVWSWSYTIDIWRNGNTV